MVSSAMPLGPFWNQGDPSVGKPWVAPVFLFPRDWSSGSKPQACFAHQRLQCMRNWSSSLPLLVFGRGGSCCPPCLLYSRVTQSLEGTWVFSHGSPGGVKAWESADIFLGATFTWLVRFVCFFFSKSGHSFFRRKIWNTDILVVSPGRAAVLLVKMKRNIVRGPASASGSIVTSAHPCLNEEFLWLQECVLVGTERRSGTLICVLFKKL